MAIRSRLEMVSGGRELRSDESDPGRAEVVAFSAVDEYVKGGKGGMAQYTVIKVGRRGPV